MTGDAVSGTFRGISVLQRNRRCPKSACWFTVLPLPTVGIASVPSGTYAFRLARKLGYDLINLGCAGSCQMDEAMASYIGSRDDWDVALFELGVNVIETWDGDRLYGKALAFLAAVLEARPYQQVFVTDMYYNRYDF